jgi:tRNA pseudouridine55 synthase
MVSVHRWEIRGWRSDEELEVTIACGGGTYIRSLARDLGRLAGGAAHLSALRRTRSGPFSVDDAITLDSLDRDVTLRPALEGLAGIPAVAVTPSERERIARGQAIDASRTDAAAGTMRAVLVDEEREILAIAERQDASWAPRVVLIDA